MSNNSKKNTQSNPNNSQEGEGQKKVMPEARKRPKFDKNKQLIKKVGCWFQVRLYKQYLHIATDMDQNVYDLINDAMEYYYEKELRKSYFQKLREAGQEELIF